MSAGLCERFILIGAAVLGVVAGAGVKDDIGYSRLAAEVGAGLADGSTVRVSIVEAGSSYLPDPNNAQFVGKSITPMSGATGTSGHATTVGQYFFGNSSSQTPGITTIHAYSAADWVNNHVGSLMSVEEYDVQNHSYVAYADSSEQAAVEALVRRFDYMIDRDDYVACFGLNNGSDTAVPQVWGYTYNGIVVGRSDGGHSNAGETLYEGAGRIRPDLVAPMTATSYATPTVASSAALLIDHARRQGMADGERSQVVKALLMAGATKEEFGGAWSNSTTQPLDTLYGAGELNIYNSFTMLDSGRYAASAASLAGLRGWDYGTSGAATAQYFLEVPLGYELQNLSALVTWNREAVDDYLVFQDLSLGFRQAEGFLPGSTVAYSDSSVDNVEHVFLDSLSSGTYVFEINAAGGGVADYGFAWTGELLAIPEPGAGVLLAAAGLLCCCCCRRRPRSRG